MAVTFLGTDPDTGISGSASSENGVREFHARYRLRSTEAPSDAVWKDVFAVLKANGISLGGTCPVDSGAWVKKIAPQTIRPRNLGGSARGARRWDFAVDVDFTSNPLNNPEQQDDPSLRPPTITFTSTKWTSPALTDVLTLKPVKNSANDPINRERRRASLVVKISKVFRKYDPTFAYEQPKGYVLTRNSAPWSPVPDAYRAAFDPDRKFVVPIGQARLEDLTIAPTFENGLVYARVDAEFHVDPQGFVDEFLDQGFLQLGPDGSRIRIVDGAGWATTPQLLDGAGHKLADGAKPVSLLFQYYVPDNWKPLSLP